MPQDYPSPSPTDFLGAPEMATPDANRAAMVTALRRQQQAQSPDLLFAMGENPVAAPYGHAALQEQDRALQRQVLAQRYGGLDAFHQGELEARNRRLADQEQGLGAFAKRPTLANLGDRVVAVSPDTSPGAAPGALATSLVGTVGARPALGRSRGAPAGGGAPTDPAAHAAFVDQLADAVHAGNKLSDLVTSRGASGQALQQAVMQRYFQKYQGENPGEMRAGLSADTGSLKHLQAQSDSINSFTRTFDKNLGVLENSLAQLDSSDTPIINRGYRAWQGAKGSPALTSFQNALNTVRSELAKINSGATGAGGAPISVLQEMEHGLPENATPAQVLAALRVYRQDSENRRAAMDEQLGAIRDRMHGGKKTEAPASSSAPNHDAAFQWLNDPKNKTDPNYARVLAAYKKAHGG